MHWTNWINTGADLHRTRTYSYCRYSYILRLCACILPMYQTMPDLSCCCPLCWLQVCAGLCFDSGPFWPKASRVFSSALHLRWHYCLTADFLFPAAKVSVFVHYLPYLPCLPNLKLPLSYRMFRIWVFSTLERRPRQTISWSLVSFRKNPRVLTCAILLSHMYLSLTHWHAHYFCMC